MKCVCGTGHRINRGLPFPLLEDQAKVKGLGIRVLDYWSTYVPCTVASIPDLSVSVFIKALLTPLALDT